MPEQPPHEDRERERQRVEAERRVEAGEAPWQHEQGVMAVVDALRDVRFPASAAAIREQAGDREVSTSKRLTLPVAEILAHLPEQEFASLGEFQTALQRHWQAIRFLEVPPEQRSPEGGFQPTQRADWPHHAGRAPQGLKHVDE